MPRILEKALRNINQTKLSRVSKSVKNEENEGGELHNFVRYNESGLNNLLVYLFWIVVSFLFNDFDHISFTLEFIEEVRQVMIVQYRAIYFNYLLRLKK